MKLATEQKTLRECCTEPKCETGLRNNYFEGKRLTADSFRVEQEYLLQRRWLLNRAVHGWGVVYGYRITSSADGRLTIGPGLAFDKPGRELIQVEHTDLELNDLLVLDEKSRPIDLDQALAAVRPIGVRPGPVPARTCWLLSVHYAERNEGPQDVNDPCACEHREWDRTCETVRYSLRNAPWDECCNDFECELECVCRPGRCCDEPVATRTEPVTKAEAVATKAEPVATREESVTAGDDRSRGEAAKPARRGGCRCLCEHLMDVSFTKDGHLYDVEDPCGGMRVDLGRGVPLARLEIVRDGRGGWEFGDDVDACGPRRLVKRNDLLFDLIRGCDLTRISDFGWKQWHRGQRGLVSFEDFSDAWGAGPKGGGYVTKRFWVRFSRPVREETLQPDCFAITVVIPERENWLRTLRVPIVDIVKQPQTGDPPGHVSEARIVVKGKWVEDGVKEQTVFSRDRDEILVEVEVRGDFIVDCNGQAVDANAVGLSPFPSGNGTPGGTFLSSFRVAAPIR